MSLIQPTFKKLTTPKYEHFLCPNFLIAFVKSEHRLVPRVFSI